jgi:hypothetical protein
MIKRLFPLRWAAVAAWTAAAITWAASLLAVGELSAAPAAVIEPPAAPPGARPAGTIEAVVPVPDPPASGLVILRYTPVPPPAPQEIIRTVSVAGARRQATSQTAPATVQSSGS